MIQLDENQHKKLKEIAAEQHVSIAELVRRGVDLLLEDEEAGGTEIRKRRAMEAAGRFKSGAADVSEKHDEYLIGMLGRKSR